MQTDKEKYGVERAISMTKRKLAICIPTYERSDIVCEFVQHKVEDYLQYDVDIYFFDSSVSTETKDVVCSYYAYNSRVFYIPLSPDVQSNQKVFIIFSKEKLYKEYEYVWVCSDALRCRKNVLDSVLDYLEKCKPDLLVINKWLPVKNEFLWYGDSNKFLADCALSTTYYGGVIVRGTVLDEKIWEKFKEKYLAPYLINFSHVKFYYEYIAMHLDGKYACLTVSPQEMTESTLKKTSGWYRECFEMLSEGWIEVIDSLPSIYSKESKDLAVKSFGHRIIGGSNLVRLKKAKIYNVSILIKYWKQICRMTDESLLHLGVIALCPNCFLDKLIDNKIRVEFRKLKKISRGKKIYIYGAGVYGKKLYYLCKKNKIKICGFCVTTLNDTSTEIEGLPVYELTELKSEYINSVLIMGASTYNRAEMLNVLKEMDLDKTVFESDICEYISEVS